MMFSILVLRGCSLYRGLLGVLFTVQVFKEFVDSDPTCQQRVKDLRDRVEAFASTYPMPGFDNH